MNRLTHATRAVDLFGSGKDGYTDGVVGVTPRTVLNSAAMNPIQEEIARAIEEFLTLDGGNLGQLAAVLRGITKNVTTVNKSSSAAVFSTLDTTADHVGNPSNAWKLVLSMRTSTDRRARLYVGTGGSFPGGGCCITLNGQWDPNGNTWSHDDDAFESSQLLLSRNGMNYRMRASGAGTWTNSDWTHAGAAVGLGDLSVSGTATIGTLSIANISTPGNVTAGGNLIGVNANLSGDVTCDDITVSDDVNAGGEITAGTTVTGTDVESVEDMICGRDLTVADDVTIGDELNLTTGNVNFAPARTRTDEINLMDCSPGEDGYIAEVIGVIFTDAVVPLRLPVGSVINWVELMFAQATTTPSVSRFTQIIGASWGSSQGARNQIASPDTTVEGPSSVGTFQVRVEASSPVTISGNTRYYCSWQGGDPADALVAVRVNWTEPGLRIAL